MVARELLGQALGLCVDDEVDITLPVQGNVFRSMPRDAAETHGFEQPAEFGGIRGRVFDELESVGRKGACIFARGFGCVHDLRARDEAVRFVQSARPSLSKKSVLFRTSLSNI